MQEALRAEFLRQKCFSSSSIYSILAEQNTVWCPFIADSMTKLIAHVIGHHGGNPFLQPGLREAIKATWMAKRTLRVTQLLAWNDALLNASYKTMAGDGILSHRIMKKPIDVDDIDYTNVMKLNKRKTIGWQVAQELCKLDVPLDAAKVNSM